MCDDVTDLECYWEAFDGVALLEADLDTYLTTNILVTFTEILGTRYHFVDVILVVLGVTGACVTVPETGVGHVC